MVSQVWHLKIINLEIPRQYAHMFGNLAPVSLTAANGIGGGRQSGASGENAALEETPNTLHLRLLAHPFWCWSESSTPRRVELVEQYLLGVTTLNISHWNFQIKVDGRSQVIVVIGLIS